MDEERRNMVIDGMNKEKTDLRIPPEYLDVANRWLGDQQQISILFTLLGIGQGNDFLVGDQTNVTFQGDQEIRTVTQSTTDDYEKLKKMLETLGLHATYLPEKGVPNAMRMYYAPSEESLQQLLELSQQESGNKNMWEAYGHFYGYPHTAVAAFPDDVADNASLPEDIRLSRLYQALPFLLSKEHYREEWQAFLQNFKKAIDTYSGLAKDFTTIRQNLYWNDHSAHPTKL